MKRSLLAGLLALVAGVASAGTLSPLQLPAQIPVAYYYRDLCVGQAFSPDGSVLGTCDSSRTTACSGRGCQGVTWTDIYDVAWDTEGNVMTAVHCGLKRHHLPQVDTVTYDPGFDSTSCAAFGTLATSTVVQINGVYYYFVVANGVSEVVNAQTQSYVYVF